MTLPLLILSPQPLKLTEILSTKKSCPLLTRIQQFLASPFVQTSSALSFVVCRRASAPAAACPPFNLPSQVFFALPPIFLLLLHRSRGIDTYLYLLFALRSVRSWLLHLGFMPPTLVDPNHHHLHFVEFLCSVCCTSYNEN